MISRLERIHLSLLREVDQRGIAKQIFLGLRNADKEIDFIEDFIKLAGTKRPTLTATKKRAARGVSKR